jgi:hypothetical protein
LNEKVAAPVKKTELTTGGIRCTDHATPSILKKLALTSPTSGGRSVGIVRLRTKGHGVFLLFKEIKKSVKCSQFGRCTLGFRRIISYMTFIARIFYNMAPYRFSSSNRHDSEQLTVRNSEGDVLSKKALE